jgi:hypothetical protein
MKLRYRVKIAGKFTEWFWIRPEFTPNTLECATEFQTMQECEETANEMKAEWSKMYKIVQFNVVS